MCVSTDVDGRVITSEQLEYNSNRKKEPNQEEEEDARGEKEHWKQLSC